MKFNFLGTGTSQGVPVVGCGCPVCKSNDKKDNRLRTSLLVESDTTTVAIDAGPDFRYQLLRAGVQKLDAIVYTHEHNDHIAGLDEVRSFNYLQGKPMDLYCTERVEQSLRRMFYYVFENSDYPGVPRVRFHRIGAEAFQVGDIHFQPIPMMHGNMPVFGYRMGDFTYITDANYIGETEKNLVRHSKVLVVDALRRTPHHSHFSLKEAIALAHELDAKQTYLTHISHHMGLHAEVNREIPENTRLAHDGLVVEL